MEESNRREPVIEFRNDKELNEMIKWWKRKLFLNHWFLAGTLVDADEMDDKCGHIDFCTQNMTGYIKISKNDEKIYADNMIKYCAEEILVHEILHVKYNLLQPDRSLYESVYTDICQHQLLEQMARSLICVKYGLDPSWFYNKECL